MNYLILIVCARPNKKNNPGTLPKKWGDRPQVNDNITIARNFFFFHLGSLRLQYSHSKTLILRVNYSHFDNSVEFIWKPSDGKIAINTTVTYGLRWQGRRWAMCMTSGSIESLRGDTRWEAMNWHLTSKPHKHGLGRKVPFGSVVWDKVHRSTCSFSMVFMNWTTGPSSQCSHMYIVLPWRKALDEKKKETRIGARNHLKPE